MIFIGLLKTEAVGGKVHMVEHLRACSLLPPLHPSLFTSCKTELQIPDPPRLD